MFVQPIDYVLVVWFALAGLSTAYVSWDQFRNNTEPAVMKWGLILVTLYLGPVGLLLYVLADKEPLPGTHEAFVKPIIEYVAGFALGLFIFQALFHEEHDGRHLLGTRRRRRP